MDIDVQNLYKHLDDQLYEKFGPSSSYSSENEFVTEDEINKVECDYQDWRVEKGYAEEERRKKTRDSRRETDRIYDHQYQDDQYYEGRLD